MEPHSWREASRFRSLPRLNLKSLTIFANSKARRLCRSLDCVKEGFEGGFVLEAGAHAVALFRHDEFGFNGVTRDDAERWVFPVDEIDDVKKVSDEISIC